MCCDAMVGVMHLSAALQFAGCPVRLSAQQSIAAIKQASLFVNG